MPRYKPFVNVAATDDYSGMIEITNDSEVEQVTGFYFSKKAEQART